MNGPLLTLSTTRSSGPVFTENDTAAQQNGYLQSIYQAEHGVQQIFVAPSFDVLSFKANFVSLVCAVQRRWPVRLAARDNFVDLITPCISHPQPEFSYFGGGHKREHGMDCRAFLAMPSRRLWMMVATDAKSYEKSI